MATIFPLRSNVESLEARGIGHLPSRHGRSKNSITETLRLFFSDIEYFYAECASRAKPDFLHLR
jgi:hypothetical protein